MRTIPKKTVQDYSDALDGILSDATDGLADDLAPYIDLFVSDETDRDMWRDAIVDQVYARISTGVQRGMTEADDLFADLTDEDRLGGMHSDYEPELDGNILSGAEGTVRRAAGYLFDESFGDDAARRDAFMTSVNQYINKTVGLAPNKAMSSNVKHSGVQEMRYASVPTGFETCGFCFMLASRGFDFKDDISNHWHPGCRCRAIPGVQGQTQVSGYDPDKYYDQYLDDLHSGKLKLTSSSKKNNDSTRWPSKKFSSLRDFEKFIEDATDIEDLQQRCAVCEQEWGKTGLSDKYYSSLQRAVRLKRSELIDAVNSGDAKSLLQRNFSTGLRKSPFHELDESEMEGIRSDASDIGIPADMLRFNEGYSTSYNSIEDVINIRGDILPDSKSTENRDTMTSRAVLAHEYYGHARFKNTRLNVGDWRDEFRASYRAAIDTPNLSDDERASLMVDAYQRAADAGMTLKITKEYRRIVYGY